MNDTSGDQPRFGRRDETRPIVPKSANEALRPEAGTPPPPRRRSRQSRSQVVVFLNFLFSIVVLAVLAGAALFWFGKTEFEARGPLAEADTVMIRPNTGVGEIAATLERGGFISDARIFRVGVQVSGKAGQLKAGEYEIKAGASMREIMNLLESGRSLLYSLTIPEGITVAQAFQRIAEHEALTGDMPSEMPPEGSLIADTQRFTRGTPREQVIRKMVAEQKALVEDIWSRRADDLPIENIDQFVTLASIVEKETGRGDERSHVASVFINRLNRGMRLQSDPTIIYGIWGGEGKPPDEPIRQSHIADDNPYNTYVINGLPPGPIANPGRAALEAVANPSRTNDLYFVADGTGGHVFAETLEEHNENVARWRRIEKQRREAGETVDQSPGTGVVPEAD
ncbi:MAG: endolytic transglycosylase MltG [Rhizobiaceae bacterium]|nr:endolytic transglycosylase MltG [Rhizobiaceae bacterium]MCV0408115.1 endolytic transglycosylase MltG [Rhizobiaceae bacterium]